MEHGNITQVIKLLVRELDIEVSLRSIRDEIAMHPNCQSMLAISELLDNWKIPNSAYQLTIDELLNAKITIPFIAYFSDNNGDFVLVHSITEQKFIVSNSKWNRKSLSTVEFSNMYGGAILMAKKEKESGESDYKRKYRKEIVDKLRNPFIWVGTIVVIMLSVFVHLANILTANWQIVLLVTVKVFGLIISILLLAQSIDRNNPFIQKLCIGANNKNCNHLLSSKAAKITDYLSWSEVGFFYFAGTLLGLLFNSTQTSLLQVMAIMNILSLPYTVYSIYYQLRVAKQWCIFCCTIQILIWLEFFAFLPSLRTGIYAPDLIQCFNMFIGLVIPILIWVFIKPYLSLSKQIIQIEEQLRNFKYNTTLFNKLLQEEIQYPLLNDEIALNVGNREAEHVITMVSNPFCQPCSEMHKELDELLCDRDDIKLQILFATSNGDDDPSTQVASHLLSMQVNKNDQSLAKALNDWYERKDKNYKLWSNKFPVKQTEINSFALEKQREWCEMTEITGTPTIFFNGRKLPPNYKPKDLKYLF